MKRLHALLVLLSCCAALRTAGAAPPENLSPIDCAPATAAADSADCRRVTLSIGLDLVSSYVCRGSYQTGTSLQPALQIAYGPIGFRAWGSVGKDLREVDLTIYWQLQRFELALTDYYVTATGPGSGRDFFTGGRNSPHSFELSLAWSVSERFPLGLWWGTMFAGSDYGDDGKRNYSTYVKVSYPFTLPLAIDMETGFGFMPWSTENCFGTRGFALTNVYLHAARNWNLVGRLRLGLLARLICNPYKEEFHFVGGLSLHM